LVKYQLSIFTQTSLYEGKDLLPLLIFGAGGHTKVLLEVLLKEKHHIIGVIAPIQVSGTNYLGLPIIGNDDSVFKYSTEDVLLINGIGSLPGKKRRWNLALMMRERGYRFNSVVHPNTTISSDVLLAEGVQIMAGVIIQPGCKIGQDSIINTGSQIDHDSVIGSNCHISPGVTISGGVNIGNNVHIGTGAKLIQGVTVGAGSVIAAGTTVYKDVPGGVIVRQQARIVMEGLKG